jgi:type IV secretion system protein TrbF
MATTTAVISEAVLTGRREYETVYANLAKGKRNWQVVAFAMTGILGVVTVGFVRLALTSRVTPYVVEVDRFGRAQAFGPVEPLKRTDTRVVIAQLVAFVRDVRSVMPSGSAEADVLTRAYAFVDQGAATFLNAYFSDVRNDPRVLGRTETRIVEVTSVLPVPKSAVWKVRWIETDYPTAVGTPVASAWEGYFGVRIVPPATTDAIEVNPLGVYVTSVTWTRVGTASVPAGTEGP